MILFPNKFTKIIALKAYNNHKFIEISKQLYQSTSKNK